MKIIALLPVKNEAWVLPSYLSSVTKIADEIIALNDNSCDETFKILSDSGVKIVEFDSEKEKVVNMSIRRRLLLKEGRDAGGTHFIWLDADETFSANFILNARKYISELKPGQKMTLRWIHAWKNGNNYLSDNKSPFGKIWKDFIICDDGIAGFEDKFLSEGRTPGKLILPKVLKENEGVVLHWQFINGEAMHYKHAWYKCQELIKGLRSARRINVTYDVNYDESAALETKEIPRGWIDGIIIPSKFNGNAWHKKTILKDFDIYGIEKFEPLDIWKMDELLNEFIRRTGRKPAVKKFPGWIIKINSVKNYLANFLQKLHT